MENVTLYLFILGPLFYGLAWFLTSRMVRCIILHKGGKHISFITNHLLKSRNTITVPIQKVGINQIKIINNCLYFMYIFIYRKYQ